MDRVSNIYASKESKNSSKSYVSNGVGRRFYGDKNAYQEAEKKEIRRRLDEQAKRIEELKKIVAELENRAKKSVTVAPLKNELVYSAKPTIQKMEVKELDKNAKKKRAIQSYSGSIKPRIPQISNYEKPINLPETEIKKTSLWDRIKSKIKAFFAEPEEPKLPQKQNDYERFTSYTKREQFMKNMTVDVTYNLEKQNKERIEEDRRKIQNRGHILDRYI